MACAVLCGTVVSMAGDIVLEDSFDGDLSLWQKFGSKVKTFDGKLVIEIPEGSDAADRYVNGQIASGNNEGLNFYRSPVEIQLSEIDADGSAAPDNRMVGYWLGPEVGFDLNQKATLHTYVRDGFLRLQLYTRPGDGSKLELRVPVQVPVSLPIHRYSLLLDAEGFVVTIEDSSGTQSKQMKWTDALKGDLLPAWESAWKEAQPELIVRATEGMDSGNCRFTLENIKVIKGASR